MDTLVSIIIPVFNAELFLREALESIRQQSHKEFEVILIDDGSTDNSAAIVKEYCSVDSRFRYTYKTNGGAASARNYGIELARGQYYMFLDADDVFDCFLLEKMLAHAIASSADIVVCSADAFQSRTGQSLGKLHSHNAPPNCELVYDCKRGHLFQDIAGWLWDKLFRADYISRLGLRFQDVAYSNDTFFVFVALAEAKSIFLFDDILVHYRIGSGFSIRDRLHDNLFCDLLAADAVWHRLINDRCMSDSMLASFREWCAYFVFETALKIANQRPGDLSLFCKEFFSKYESNWHIEELTYTKVLSKKILWKYLRFRNSSVSGFIWAVRGEARDRTNTQGKALSKKIGMALRLFVSSCCTRGVAKTIKRIEE